MAWVIKRERIYLIFIYGSLDKNHVEVHILPVLEDYFRFQSVKNSGVREHKILVSEPHLDFRLGKVQPQPLAGFRWDCQVQVRASTHSP